MNTNTHSHWNARFSSTDPEDLSWFQKNATISLRLLERFAGDQISGLIDMGAGNSRLVDGLLAKGARDLTLFDLSEAALAQTRARLAGEADQVTFQTGDVRNWQPKRRWDIWHDRAVFHFMVSEADQTAYLAALDQGTESGALILLATFSPNGPEKCSGLPVARYDATGLSDRLGVGYELLHNETLDHMTPGGAAQNFTHAVFRKR
jgi:methyltransferase family protein